MTVAQSGWAFEQRLPAAAKLVLIRIMDWQGRASIPNLAEWTSLSRDELNDAFAEIAKLPGVRLSYRDDQVVVDAPIKEDHSRAESSRGHQRRAINPNLWRGKRCHYCGGRASGVDHVVALSRGGSESAENLVPACERCNKWKGAKLTEEFRYLLMLRAARQTSRFAGEKVEAPTRDFIFVASPAFHSSMAKINSAS